MKDTITKAYMNHVIITESMLTEELHSDIKNILAKPFRGNPNRVHELANTIRSLAEAGIPSGVTDDKPKRGSSRAVFFMSEPHEAFIDGEKAQIPHVLKTAFKGDLDNYIKPNTPILGQLQSMHEIESAKTHGILLKDSNGNFTTNPDGFLPPVTDHGPHGSWMTVGKIDPLDSGTFRDLTKTPDYKKGITQKLFLQALTTHYDLASGLLRSTTPEIDDLILHPLVNKALRFCAKTKTDPYDFERRNLGIWTHPVTGEKHIVASDAGYSHDVAMAYMMARANKHVWR